jgi:hypothetical protein
MDRILHAELSKSAQIAIRKRYDIKSVMPDLIRICEIALHSKTRNEIRKILDNDKHFITSVDNNEISHLLSNLIGFTSLKERLLMKCVHIPWLYRFYRIIKQLG